MLTCRHICIENVTDKKELTDFEALHFCFGRQKKNAIHRCHYCFLYISRSKQLIKDAILDNDFLKKLDSTQIREVVECMYEKQVHQGHYIIREGDAGQHVYVAAGEISNNVNNRKL